ncbi:MAG: hypothetical protein V9E94_04180 [Microthrixaceae bacterium]
MTDHEMTPQLEGYVFAVAENAFCCWDFDHESRSLSFLEGLDVGYFATISAMATRGLQTDDAPSVSVMLRVTYHQAVETLMSLLGAMAQAPRAVPAWLAKCSTGDLQNVVASLSDGHQLLTPIGRRVVTFEHLASLIHGDHPAEAPTRSAFAKFWQRLSDELLDETARAEHNALKHGTRVAPGGVTILVGDEVTPGAPAPQDSMRPLGDDRFGTTFYVIERAGSSRHHIRTHRTSLNWNPEALASRLRLISMSIGNVVAALRCDLGADPATVTMLKPDPLIAFENAWKRSPSVRSSSIDAVFTIRPSDELSREQLLEFLESQVEGD